MWIYASKGDVPVARPRTPRRPRESQQVPLNDDAVFVNPGVSFNRGDLVKRSVSCKLRSSFVVRGRDL